MALRSALGKKAGTLSRTSAKSGRVYSTISQRKVAAEIRRETGVEPTPEQLDPTIEPVIKEQPQRVTARDILKEQVGGRESFGIVGGKMVYGVTYGESQPEYQSTFIKYGDTPTQQIKERRKKSQSFKGLLGAYGIVQEQQTETEIPRQTEFTHTPAGIPLSKFSPKQRELLIKSMRTQERIRKPKTFTERTFSYFSKEIVDFPTSYAKGFVQSVGSPYYAAKYGTMKIYPESEKFFETHKRPSFLTPTPKDIATFGITTATFGVGALGGRIGKTVVDVGLVGYTAYSGGVALKTRSPEATGHFILSAGFGLPAAKSLAVRGFRKVTSIGKTELPLEKYAEAEILSGEKQFPTRSGTPKELVMEFKKGKYSLSQPIQVKGFQRTYTPQEYVSVRYTFKKGKSGTEQVAAFQRLGTGGWHTSGTPIKAGKVTAGASATEGLYMSPSVSTHFLRIKGENTKLSVGFLDLFKLDRPTAQFIVPKQYGTIPRSFVKSAEAKAGIKIGEGGQIAVGGRISKPQKKTAISELNKYFKEQEGTGKATPSPEFYTGKGEAETILVKDTRFRTSQLGERYNWWEKATGYKYYFKYEGEIVPIRPYKALGKGKGAVVKGREVSGEQLQRELSSSERYLSTKTVEVPYYSGSYKSVYGGSRSYAVSYDVPYRTPPRTTTRVIPYRTPPRTPPRITTYAIPYRTPPRTPPRTTTRVIPYRTPPRTTIYSPPHRTPPRTPILRQYKNWGKQSKKIYKRLSKQPRAITPSGWAAVGGIKGKITKGDIRTGLGGRPIRKRKPLLELK